MATFRLRVDTVDRVEAMCRFRVEVRNKVMFEVRNRIMDRVRLEAMFS